jgi:hypothetical protein
MNIFFCLISSCTYAVLTGSILVWRQILWPTCCNFYLSKHHDHQGIEEKERLEGDGGESLLIVEEVEEKVLKIHTFI